MTCTFKDCTNEATHELKSKDESVWANLCDEHNSKLEEAISKGDTKVVVGLRKTSFGTERENPKVWMDQSYCE